jgi:hypothetical protein
LIQGSASPGRLVQFQRTDDPGRMCTQPLIWQVDLVYSFSLSRHTVSHVSRLGRRACVGEVLRFLPNEAPNFIQAPKFAENVPSPPDYSSHFATKPLGTHPRQPRTAHATSERGAGARRSSAPCRVGYTYPPVYTKKRDLPTYPEPPSGRYGTYLPTYPARPAITASVTSKSMFHVMSLHTSLVQLHSGGWRRALFLSRSPQAPEKKNRCGGRLCALSCFFCARRHCFAAVCGLTHLFPLRSACVLPRISLGVGRHV